MAKGKLTPKQERFAAEYVVDLNATQAAKRAGYRGRDAVLAVTGHTLLRNPKVAAIVKAKAEASAQRVAITADVVLGELLRLARVDISQAFDEEGRLLDIRKMPEDVRRAVSGIEVETLRTDEGETIRTSVTKVKFWDKKGALELLGKHLKLFTDRLEVGATAQLAAALAGARARAGSTLLTEEPTK